MQNTGKRKIVALVTTVCQRLGISTNAFFKRAYEHVQKKRRGCQRLARDAYNNFKRGHVPGRVRDVVSKYITYLSGDSVPAVAAS